MKNGGFKVGARAWLMRLEMLPAVVVAPPEHGVYVVDVRVNGRMLRQGAVEREMLDEGEAVELIFGEL